MANNTNTGGSDTFTIAAKNLPTHTHTVGAHSHGLNSHKHSVGAHAHTVPKHGHGNTISYSMADATISGKSTGFIVRDNLIKNSGALSLKLGSVPFPSAANENCNNGELSFSSTHKHTLTKSGAVTDKDAFNTNNSTAFDSGAASGSTANSTAFESGNGGFANEAISNLPAYQNLYAWRRTA